MFWFDLDSRTGIGMGLEGGAKRRRFDCVGMVWSDRVVRWSPCFATCCPCQPNYPRIVMNVTNEKVQDGCFCLDTDRTCDSNDYINVVKRMNDRLWRMCSTTRSSCGSCAAAKVPSNHSKLNCLRCYSIVLKELRPPPEGRPKGRP